MTLHDFFIGGQAVRVAMFVAGLYYCLTCTYRDWRVAAAHIGSIVVLIVIVWSREVATLIGLPVTWLIVERMTRLAKLEDHPPRKR